MTDTAKKEPPTAEKTVSKVSKDEDKSAAAMSAPEKAEDVVTGAEGGGAGGPARMDHDPEPSTSGLGGPAPPDGGGGGALSPLSGAYLLIVLGEPISEEHKNTMLGKLRQGLLSWDESSSHVDLDKELKVINDCAPPGEELKGGERLIQFATDNLVIEVLVNPQIYTLQQCMRNMLGSFTKHRHIVHGGYTFAGTGAWLMQDGTYTYSEFSKTFEEYEIQRVMRAYENSITINIHCCEEGEWTQERTNKEHFSEFCQVKLNASEVIQSTSSLDGFLSYMSPFLVPQSIQQTLPPSDVVGNIRFSHPTLYVFPSGQGDSALFGINGFNMLIDGGFSRKACFWDFSRHLDRLDAILITRLSDENTCGMSALLQRKTLSALYPQIGHVFTNLPGSSDKLPGSGGALALAEKRPPASGDSLLINVIEEGNAMLDNLRILNLKPQLCLREKGHCEPINLYHKVGHGKLDMFVINPAKDGKELREFMERWNDNAKTLGNFRSGINVDGREIWLPLANLVSICALVVWIPDNPEDTVTRLLFPGSTPQHKVLRGLEKLKALEFLQRPVCRSGLLPKPKPTTTVKSSSYGLREGSMQRHQSQNRTAMKAATSVTTKYSRTESIKREENIEAEKEKKEAKERQEKTDIASQRKERMEKEYVQRSGRRIKTETKNRQQTLREKEKSDDEKEKEKKVISKREDMHHTSRKSEDKNMKEQKNQAAEAQAKVKEHKKDRNAAIKSRTVTSSSSSSRTMTTRTKAVDLETKLRKSTAPGASKTTKEASNKTKKAAESKLKSSNQTDKAVKAGLKKVASTTLGAAQSIVSAESSEKNVDTQDTSNTAVPATKEDETESIVEKHQLEEMEHAPIRQAAPTVDAPAKEGDDDFEPELERIKDEEEEVNDNVVRVPDIPVDAESHQPAKDLPKDLPLAAKEPAKSYHHIKTPDEVDELPEHEAVEPEILMEESLVQNSEPMQEKDKTEEPGITAKLNTKNNVLSPESEGAQQQRDLSELVVSATHLEVSCERLQQKDGAKDTDKPIVGKQTGEPAVEKAIVLKETAHTQHTMQSGDIQVGEEELEIGNSPEIQPAKSGKVLTAGKEVTSIPSEEEEKRFEVAEEVLCARQVEKTYSRPSKRDGEGIKIIEEILCKEIINKTENEPNKETAEELDIMEEVLEAENVESQSNKGNKILEVQEKDICTKEVETIASQPSNEEDKIDKMAYAHEVENTESRTDNTPNVPFEVPETTLCAPQNVRKIESSQSIEPIIIEVSIGQEELEETESQPSKKTKDQVEIIEETLFAQEVTRNEHQPSSKPEDQVEVIEDVICAKEVGHIENQPSNIAYTRVEITEKVICKNEVQTIEIQPSKEAEKQVEITQGVPCDRELQKEEHQPSKEPGGRVENTEGVHCEHNIAKMESQPNIDHESKLEITKDVPSSQEADEIKNQLKQETGQNVEKTDHVLSAQESEETDCQFDNESGERVSINEETSYSEKVTSESKINKDPEERFEKTEDVICSKQDTKNVESDSSKKSEDQADVTEDVICVKEVEHIESKPINEEANKSAEITKELMHKDVQKMQLSQKAENSNLKTDNVDTCKNEADHMEGQTIIEPKERVEVTEVISMQKIDQTESQPSADLESKIKIIEKVVDAQVVEEIQSKLSEEEGQTAEKRGLSPIAMENSASKSSNIPENKVELTKNDSNSEKVESEGMPNKHKEEKVKKPGDEIYSQVVKHTENEPSQKLDDQVQVKEGIICSQGVQDIESQQSNVNNNRVEIAEEVILKEKFQNVESQPTKEDEKRIKTTEGVFCKKEADKEESLTMEEPADRVGITEKVPGEHDILKTGSQQSIEPENNVENTKEAISLQEVVKIKGQETEQTAEKTEHTLSAQAAEEHEGQSGNEPEVRVQIMEETPCSELVKSESKPNKDVKERLEKPEDDVCSQQDVENAESVSNKKPIEVGEETEDVICSEEVESIEMKPTDSNKEPKERAGITEEVPCEKEVDKEQSQPCKEPKERVEITEVLFERAIHLAESQPRIEAENKGEITEEDISSQEADIIKNQRCQETDNTVEKAEHFHLPQTAEETEGHPCDEPEERAQMSEDVSCSDTVKNESKDSGRVEMSKDVFCLQEDVEHSESEPSKKPEDEVEKTEDVNCAKEIGNIESKSGNHEAVEKTELSISTHETKEAKSQSGNESEERVKIMEESPCSQTVKSKSKSNQDLREKVEKPHDLLSSQDVEETENEPSKMPEDQLEVTEEIICSEKVEHIESATDKVIFIEEVQKIEKQPDKEPEKIADEREDVPCEKEVDRKDSQSVKAPEHRLEATEEIHGKHDNNKTASQPGIELENMGEDFKDVVSSEELHIIMGQPSQDMKQTVEKTEHVLSAQVGEETDCQSGNGLEKRVQIMEDSPCTETVQSKTKPDQDSEEKVEKPHDLLSSQDVEEAENEPSKKIEDLIEVSKEIICSEKVEHIESGPGKVICKEVQRIEDQPDKEHEKKADEREIVPCEKEVDKKDSQPIKAPEHRLEGKEEVHGEHDFTKTAIQPGIELENQGEISKDVVSSEEFNTIIGQQRQEIKQNVEKAEHVLSAPEGEESNGQSSNGSEKRVQIMKESPCSEIVKSESKPSQDPEGRDGKPEDDVCSQQDVEQTESEASKKPVEVVEVTEDFICSQDVENIEMKPREVICKEKVQKMETDFNKEPKKGAEKTEEVPCEKEVNKEQSEPRKEPEEKVEIIEEVLVKQVINETESQPSILPENQVENKEEDISLQEVDIIRSKLSEEEENPVEKTKYALSAHVGEETDCQLGNEPEKRVQIMDESPCSETVKSESKPNQDPEERVEKPEDDVCSQQEVKQAESESSKKPVEVVEVTEDVICSEEVEYNKMKPNEVFCMEKVQKMENDCKKEPKKGAEVTEVVLCEKEVDKEQSQPCKEPEEKVEIIEEVLLEQVIIETESQPSIEPENKVEITEKVVFLQEADIIKRRPSNEKEHPVENTQYVLSPQVAEETEVHLFSEPEERAQITEYISCSETVKSESKQNRTSEERVEMTEDVICLKQDVEQCESKPSKKPEDQVDVTDEKVNFAKEIDIIEIKPSNQEAGDRADITEKTMHKENADEMEMQPSEGNSKAINITEKFPCEKKADQLEKRLALKEPEDLVEIPEVVLGEDRINPTSSQQSNELESRVKITKEVFDAQDVDIKQSKQSGVADQAVRKEDHDLSTPEVRKIESQSSIEEVKKVEVAKKGPCSVIVESESEPHKDPEEKVEETDNVTCSHDVTQAENEAGKELEDQVKVLEGVICSQEDQIIESQQRNVSNNRVEIVEDILSKEQFQKINSQPIKEAETIIKVTEEGPCEKESGIDESQSSKEPEERVEITEEVLYEHVISKTECKLDIEPHSKEGIKVELTCTQEVDKTQSEKDPQEKGKNSGDGMFSQDVEQGEGEPKKKTEVSVEMTDVICSQDVKDIESKSSNAATAEVTENVNFKEVQKNGSESITKAEKIIEQTEGIPCEKEADQMESKPSKEPEDRTKKGEKIKGVQEVEKADSQASDEAEDTVEITERVISSKIDEETGSKRRKNVDGEVVNQGKEIEQTEEIPDKDLEKRVEITEDVAALQLEKIENQSSKSTEQRMEIKKEVLSAEITKHTGNLPIKESGKDFDNPKEVTSTQEDEYKEHNKDDKFEEDTSSNSKQAEEMFPILAKNRAEVTESECVKKVKDHDNGQLKSSLKEEEKGIKESSLDIIEATLEKSQDVLDNATMNISAGFEQVTSDMSETFQQLNKDMHEKREDASVNEHSDPRKLEHGILEEKAGEGAADLSIATQKDAETSLAQEEKKGVTENVLTEEESSMAKSKNIIDNVSKNISSRIDTIACGISDTIEHPAEKDGNEENKVISDTETNFQKILGETSKEQATDELIKNSNLVAMSDELGSTPPAEPEIKETKIATSKTVLDNVSKTISAGFDQIADEVSETIEFLTEKVNKNNNDRSVLKSHDDNFNQPRQPISADQDDEKCCDGKEVSEIKETKNYVEEVTLERSDTELEINSTVLCHKMDAIHDSASDTIKTTENVKVSEGIEDKDQKHIVKSPGVVQGGKKSILFTDADKVVPEEKLPEIKEVFTSVKEATLEISQNMLENMSTSITAGVENIDTTVSDTIQILAEREDGVCDDQATDKEKKDFSLTKPVDKKEDDSIPNEEISSTKDIIEAVKEGTLETSQNVLENLSSTITAGIDFFADDISVTIKNIGDESHAVREQKESIETKSEIVSKYMDLKPAEKEMSMSLEKDADKVHVEQELPEVKEDFMAVKEANLETSQNILEKVSKSITARVENIDTADSDAIHILAEREDGVCGDQATDEEKKNFSLSKTADKMEDNIIPNEDISNTKDIIETVKEGTLETSQNVLEKISTTLTAGIDSIADDISESIKNIKDESAKVRDHEGSIERKDEIVSKELDLKPAEKEKSTSLEKEANMVYAEQKLPEMKEVIMAVEEANLGTSQNTFEKMSTSITAGVENIDTAVSDTIHILEREVGVCDDQATDEEKRNFSSSNTADKKEDDSMQNEKISSTKDIIETVKEGTLETSQNVFEKVSTTIISGIDSIAGDISETIKNIGDESDDVREHEGSIERKAEIVTEEMVIKPAEKEKSMSLEKHADIAHAEQELPEIKEVIMAVKEATLETSQNMLENMSTSITARVENIDTTLSDAIHILAEKEDGVCGDQATDEEKRNFSLSKTADRKEDNSIPNEYIINTKDNIETVKEGTLETSQNVFEKVSTTITAGIDSIAGDISEKIKNIEDESDDVREHEGSIERKAEIVTEGMVIKPAEKEKSMSLEKDDDIAHAEQELPEIKKVIMVVKEATLETSQTIHEKQSTSITAGAESIDTTVSDTINILAAREGGICDNLATDEENQNFGSSKTADKEEDDSVPKEDMSSTEDIIETVKEGTLDISQNVLEKISTTITSEIDSIAGDISEAIKNIGDESAQGSDQERIIEKKAEIVCEEKDLKSAVKENLMSMSLQAKPEVKETIFVKENVTLNQASPDLLDTQNRDDVIPPEEGQENIQEIKDKSNLTQSDPIDTVDGDSLKSTSLKGEDFVEKELTGFVEEATLGKLPNFIEKVSTTTFAGIDEISSNIEDKVSSTMENIPKMAYGDKVDKLNKKTSDKEEPQDTESKISAQKEIFKTSEKKLDKAVLTVSVGLDCINREISEVFETQKDETDKKADNDKEVEEDMGQSKDDAWLRQTKQISEKNITQALAEMDNTKMSPEREKPKIREVTVSLNEATFEPTRKIIDKASTSLSSEIKSMSDNVSRTMESFAEKTGAEDISEEDRETDNSNTLEDDDPQTVEPSERKDINTKLIEEKEMQEIREDTFVVKEATLETSQKAFDDRTMESNFITSGKNETSPSKEAPSTVKETPQKVPGDMCSKTISGGKENLTVDTSDKKEFVAGKDKEKSDNIDDKTESHVTYFDVTEEITADVIEITSQQTTSDKVHVPEFEETVKHIKNEAFEKSQDIAGELVKHTSEAIQKFGETIDQTSSNLDNTKGSYIMSSLDKNVQDEVNTTKSNMAFTVEKDDTQTQAEEVEPIIEETIVSVNKAMLETTDREIKKTEVSAKAKEATLDTSKHLISNVSTGINKIVGDICETVQTVTGDVISGNNEDPRKRSEQLTTEEESDIPEYPDELMLKEIEDQIEVEPTGTNVQRQEISHPLHTIGKHNEEVKDMKDKSTSLLSENKGDSVNESDKRIPVTEKIVKTVVYELQTTDEPTTEVTHAKVYELASKSPEDCMVEEENKKSIMFKELSGSAVTRTTVKSVIEAPMDAAEGLVKEIIPVKEFNLVSGSPEEAKNTTVMSMTDSPVRDREKVAREFTQELQSIGEPTDQYITKVIRTTVTKSINQAPVEVKEEMVQKRIHGQSSAKELGKPELSETTVVKSITEAPIELTKQTVKDRIVHEKHSSNKATRDLTSQTIAESSTVAPVEETEQIIKEGIQDHLNSPRLNKDTNVTETIVITAMSDTPVRVKAKEVVQDEPSGEKPKDLDTTKVIKTVEAPMEGTEEIVEEFIQEQSSAEGPWHSEITQTKIVESITEDQVEVTEEVMKVIETKLVESMTSAPVEKTEYIISNVPSMQQKSMEAPEEHHVTQVIKTKVASSSTEIPVEVRETTVEEAVRELHPEPSELLHTTTLTKTTILGTTTEVLGEQINDNILEKTHSTSSHTPNVYKDEKAFPTESVHIHKDSSSPDQCSDSKEDNDGECFQITTGGNNGQTIVIQDSRKYSSNISDEFSIPATAESSVTEIIAKAIRTVEDSSKEILRTVSHSSEKKSQSDLQDDNENIASTEISTQKSSRDFEGNLQHSSMSEVCSGVPTQLIVKTTSVKTNTVSKDGTDIDQEDKKAVCTIMEHEQGSGKIISMETTSNIVAGQNPQGAVISSSASQSKDTPLSASVSETHSAQEAKRMVSMASRSMSQVSDSSQQEIPSTSPRSDSTMSPTSLEAPVKSVGFSQEITTECSKIVREFQSFSESEESAVLTEQQEEVRSLPSSELPQRQLLTGVETSTSSSSCSRTHETMDSSHSIQSGQALQLDKFTESTSPANLTTEETVTCRQGEESVSVQREVFVSRSEGQTSTVVTKSGVVLDPSALTSEFSPSKVVKVEEQTLQRFVSKEEEEEVGVKESEEMQVQTDEEGNIVRTVIRTITTTEVVPASTVSKSKQVDKQLDSWGKPLGLPSPVHPSTPRKAGSRESVDTNKSKEAGKKSTESRVSRRPSQPPVYMDLAYVPHHGDALYTDIEFFKRVRARYYVFSGVEPSRDVFNALLEAKRTWEDKDLEVTIIPTYDTDTLGYWVAENETALAENKIDLAPSASRCTINLQDHETSCAAYRLEF